MSAAGAMHAPRTPPRGFAVPGRAVAGRPAAAPARLRVVAAPAHTRARAGLTAASVALLVVALVGLLVINVTLQRGAYQLRDQHRQVQRLTETRDALAERLQLAAAPAALAQRAAALGMVPAGSVAFLSAPDGTVLGVAQPGAAGVTAAPAAAPPAPRPSVNASSGSPKPVVGQSVPAKAAPGLPGPSPRGRQPGTRAARLAAAIGAR
jgi:hypothetical protein